MIYLVGGAPRLGKSTVAREAMKRLSVSWESTDTIRSAVNAALSPASRARFLPFASVADHDEVFRRATETIIEQQLTEARTLEGPLEAYLADHAMTDEPIILEGLHLTPAFIKKIAESRPFNNKIRAVMLLAPTTEILLRDIQASHGHHDWLRGKSDETHKAAVEFILQFSKRLESEIDENLVAVIRRSDDFARDTAAAVTALIE